MTAFIIGSIAILSLIFAGSFYEVTFISESILGITAIVILWYTWETSKIRKADQEIAGKRDADKKVRKSSDQMVTVLTRNSLSPFH